MGQGARSRSRSGTRSDLRQYCRSAGPWRRRPHGWRLFARRPCCQRRILPTPERRPVAAADTATLADSGWRRRRQLRAIALGFTAPFGRWRIASAFRFAASIGSGQWRRRTRRGRWSRRCGRRRWGRRGRWARRCRWRRWSRRRRRSWWCRWGWWSRWRGRSWWGWWGWWRRWHRRPGVLPAARVLPTALLRRLLRSLGLLRQ